MYSFKALVHLPILIYRIGIHAFEKAACQVFTNMMAVNDQLKLCNIGLVLILSWMARYVSASNCCNNMRLSVMKESQFHQLHAQIHKYYGWARAGQHATTVLQRRGTLYVSVMTCTEQMHSHFGIRWLYTVFVPVWYFSPVWKGFS